MRIPASNNSHQRAIYRLPEVWQRWRWEFVASRIWRDSQKLLTATDENLLHLARQCRTKAKLSPDNENLVVEVFALVREIADRVHGIRPHLVQILGALAMSHGWIAEMQTGEGKTLASIMTVTHLSLKGRGCHVFTANDYLATRDCEFAKPVLEWFGLKSAVLQNQISVQERAQCYQADVTYGSEKEFGFDFLRDRLSGIDEPEGNVSFSIHGTAPKIQSGHSFALIDEADSILIDQASTPMVISCPQPATPDELELFQWCDRYSSELAASNDFLLFPQQQSVKLTQRGCRRLRLTSKPPRVGRLPIESVFAQVEQALVARHFFHENQEYLVIDKRIEVIDRGTGRMLPGRKWRDGLQQAIEIQAGLLPSDATGSAARITLQSYLKNYEFLCGMTGTAAEARRELGLVYDLRVMSIATNNPCLLNRLPTRVFARNQQKWSALVDELERIVVSGRAALVGTTSITASEQCATQLRAKGLDVQVLHAKYHKEESEIIRMAGQPGRITVATNMAGRGTDIKLHPDVRAAGGLHVLLSEMNRSARIDRQLAGRAARQGDPGSSQIFVSLEDELLVILGTKRISSLQKRSLRSADGELPGHWVSHFIHAQRLFERQGELERSQLLVREQQQRAMMAPLGLDPYIELPSDQ